MKIRMLYNAIETFRVIQVNPLKLFAMSIYLNVSLCYPFILHLTVTEEIIWFDKVNKRYILAVCVSHTGRYYIEMCFYSAKVEHFRLERSTEVELFSC